MSPLDPAKVKSQTTYSHPGTFYALSLDPAGSRLYAGSDDHGIHVFDIASDKKSPSARWSQHDNYVSALACVPHPSRSLLISGSYDRHLTWWDSSTGQSIRSVEAHQGWVRDLAVLPDGEHVASVGDDMRVHLWETETGRLVRALEGHSMQTPQGHVTALYVVAVSADGKYLASGDRIGTVCVWESDTGKLAQRIEVPILYTYDPRQRKRSLGGIRALAFSSDGSLLAVGGIGQVNNVDGLSGPAHVEVWDWRKPQQRFAEGVQGHKGLINHLVFHPAGNWLLGAGGGSDNGFLAFWQTNQVEDAKQDKPDAAAQRIKTDGHIHRFCLNSTGTKLYAAGYHKLEIWNLVA